MDGMNNLLSDPILTLRREGGRTEALSLPGVLAALSAGDVEAFCALQAHQAPAWHAFLVQLAALALHRGGCASPPSETERWAELLLGLAAGEVEPWCLVVPDLAKPAFMQPPVPEGSLDRFQRRSAAPDAFDVLVTAKNHDVKMARMGQARAEHWAYTLVMVQTMEGFLGRGNYGIARMNGGFASRPAVSVEPGVSLDRRFRRDVGLLLRQRRSQIDAYDFFPEDGGHALLWLLPWDGEAALAPQDCDLWFIEVCRRLRLIDVEGVPWITMAPTAHERMAAKDLHGNLGDPWTPVTAESTAMTVSASGFSYDLVQRLLFQAELKPAPLQEVAGTDVDPWFHASVLVRGQGRTDGFHDRRLPLPPRVRDYLADRSARERLGARAKAWVEVAKGMRGALRFALCFLVQGDPARVDIKDDRPRVHTERFDREVDAVFFEALWESVEAGRDDSTAYRAWVIRLRDLGVRILEDAIESTPLPEVRRYRAINAATGAFHGTARKKFPILTEQGEEADVHHA